MGRDLEHKKKYQKEYYLKNKDRGLLCSTCNLAIGYAKDSIDILENMIKYLQRC